MSRFIETNRETSNISFDEAKFRDLEKFVYERYSWSGNFIHTQQDVLNRCHAEAQQIGQALRSDEYFTDGLGIVHRLAGHSGFREDGIKCANFAWALFLENRETIENSVQHGNYEQTWVALETVTDLVRGWRCDNKLDEVAVDFLVQNTEPAIRAKEDITNRGEGRVLQTILAYGNDDQSQFARKIILDALDDQDLSFRFSVRYWLTNLTAGPDIGGIAGDKVNFEVKTLLDQFTTKNLDQFQLTGSRIVEDWYDTGALYGDIHGNLKAICQLEEQAPGIAKALHKDFSVSHFNRYPSELLLRQYEQRDEREIPYGIIFYPKADHNEGFADDKDIFARLLQQTEQIGYALRVAEYDSKRGSLSALNKLRRRYGKAAFGILGGHGEPDRIRIGRDNEDGIIFKADVLRPAVFAARHGFLEENATLILVSCSTGAPDGIGQEMANLGVTVIAPKEPTSLKGIYVKKVDEQLQFYVDYKGLDVARIYQPKVAVVNNK